MPLWRAAWLLLLLPLTVGCGLFKQLEVDSPGHWVQKPSNVAVHLSVSDGDTPITDLTDQSFAIYENDQLVATEDSKQMLLDRELMAHFRTLLLVDVSSAQDEATRGKVARGVAGFVAALRKTQAVTVYAFDGSADLTSIGDFPKGEAGPEDLPALAALAPKDTSRNLHGAVQNGIKELGARLMTQQRSVRVGTLVVLTAGPDKAGRQTAEQLQQAVDASPYQFLVVAVGQEASYDVSAIAKHGTLWAPNLVGVGPTLADAASKVEDLMERHYLLSYCSPARAGVRRVRIEVTRIGTEGDERKGNVEFEIDTTGFTAGCDPSTPPKGGVPSAKSDKPEGDGKKPDDKKGDGKKPDDKKGDGKKPDDKKGDDIVPPPNKPGYAPTPGK
ncbi:MAG: hypothetical protein IT377_34510 [Polyangiaceae bacterium]|nr:hypothetical protein [Polyangiaceae bacterium]